MGDAIMNEKLIRLSEESIKELEDIGLGKMIPKNLNFTINYKAKNRLGQCVKKRDINISSWLLEIGLDHDIKNTIIHEILHTFKDTKGHGEQWKKYAKIIRLSHESAESITKNFRKKVKKALDIRLSM